MKEVASLKVKDSPKPKIKKQDNQLDNRIVFPIFTFFITFALLLISIAYNNIAPIGRYTMLLSDLKSQFAPNLIRFKHHFELLDFKDILSSFSYDKTLTLGKNFMSTFGYYMGSPLNIIVLFFPESMIGTAIMVLCSLRLSLGSSFLCMFLQKRATNKDSKLLIAISTTYAFTSFAVIFLFSIIWFDGYMLLPLLLFFIERFLEKNKKLGIAVTLFILFISNFYTSYMVGVFSFFYIVARVIYKNKVEENMDVKTAVIKVVKFVLVAICTIFTVGAILIPVGLDVVSNRDVLINKSENSMVQFKGIDFLEQIFFGNVGEFNVLIGNLPIIFISLIVTLLITIFFVSKTFSKKVKIFYGTILVLMLASFWFAPLDMAWQAFDRPNWFWHRYSFTFMMVFYVIAVIAIEKIKEVTNKEILKSYLFLLALLFVTQSFGKIADKGMYFIVNVLLLTGYALLFAAMKREKWPEQLKNMQTLSVKILVLLLVFETAGMGPRSSDGMSSYASGITASEYSGQIDSLIAVNNTIAPYNKGQRSSFEAFSEKANDVHINESYEAETIIGLNGVSSFDSSCNRKLMRFYKQLGYVTNFNYAASDRCYAAKPTDSFFSVGTFITTGDYTGAKQITANNDDTTYVGYAYDSVLPIGFAVDSKANDFDFFSLESLTENKDYFGFQNDWYKSMFPNEFENDVYTGIHVITDDEMTVYNGTKVPFDQIGWTRSGSFNNEDPMGNESPKFDVQERNTYFRMSESAPLAITVNYKAPKSGEQYLCIAVSSLQSSCQVFINEKQYADIYPSSYFSNILRLGYYEEGEEVSFALQTTDKSFSYLDMFTACLDDEAFDSQFAKIDQSKVVMNETSNGSYSFTTNLDEGEMLLTTIPYEKGWTCYVDGKETAITAYQDALISVDVGPGTHTVELRFVAPGLKAGIALSGVGVVSWIVFAIFDRKKKK